MAMTTSNSMSVNARRARRAGVLTSEVFIPAKMQREANRVKKCFEE
jgi:hypothetical protein